MSIALDYSDVQQGDRLIPEGDYEVIIQSAYEDATKGGTQYINIPLIVRNDIEQPYKNAYIWHSIWRAKNPTDRDKIFGGYLSSQLLRVCQAVGIPSDTRFEDLTALLDTLSGKLLRVKVKHNEYNNTITAKVQYINETQAKECHHIFKFKDDAAALAQVDGAIVEAKDEDLPFE